MPDFCRILAAGRETPASEALLQSIRSRLGDLPSTAITRVTTPDQARAALAHAPAISLLLLFTASPEDAPWLGLVRWIRQDPALKGIRIVLCCNRPGPSFEEGEFGLYDIHDFIALSLDDPAGVDQAAKTILALPLPGESRHEPANSRLEQENAAFKDFIESIGDVVWETDRQLRFVSMSSNAETFYGHSGQSFQGKSFDHAMDQETLTGSWPDIKAAMAQRRQFTNIHISRIHKTGDPGYFLTSGRPVFDHQGEWKGYRGAEKDITTLVQSEQEKKKLIAQLRHAQRLEAMGTLAGGIAHDFNNILGGILGYSQLIQFELQGNTTALAHTEHIIAGCNRAKNLILQILDFSRQRTSATPPKITDPGGIVREAVKLLRPSIPSSIHLKTEIQANAGQILADPTQIHQAILNLCTNARQAIETGQGEIAIQVEAVTLSPDNHVRSPRLDLDFGDYITITVTDTGRGIETNTLEKIFNPYFTTKKRGDGTGLGLSVVHGIVTRFNGAITVTSRPGQGSSFLLYFPKHQGKKPAEKENGGRLIQGRASVLFIDDEPMLVDIGKMMLEKLGYRVTALDTPLKGLEMVNADKDRFDIVITDMTMPDILGTQLAARIKQVNPALPVVLATGFSNILQTQKTPPGGVDAVLPKPITMATLSQTLYDLLNT